MQILYFLLLFKILKLSIKMEKIKDSVSVWYNRTLNIVLYILHKLAKAKPSQNTEKQKLNYQRYGNV